MGLLDRFSRTKKAPVIDAPAIPAVAPTAVATKKKGDTIAWKVIVQPLVSEKASSLAAMHQYVFVVHQRATKTDVRRAIKEAYGVAPLRVHMIRVRGKAVRFGRAQGVTKAWKKAIVTLPKDKKIQVYEGV